jgi:hypothetical protein
MPHSIPHGDACFAYFNKIWGIPLLNSAILFSTVSAIITSLLVIVAFVYAFYNMRHEYGVAVLFVVALGFFTVSLVYLGREARIALNELDTIARCSPPSNVVLIDWQLAFGHHEERT